MYFLTSIDILMNSIDGIDDMKIIDICIKLLKPLGLSLAYQIDRGTCTLVRVFSMSTQDYIESIDASGLKFSIACNSIRSFVFSLCKFAKGFVLKSSDGREIIQQNPYFRCSSLEEMYVKLDLLGGSYESL